MAEDLAHWLRARFGEAVAVPAEADLPALAGMARHRTLRRYHDRPVSLALLRALAGVALSAPSKSDLQQADIVIVRDPAQRAALAALLPDNPWARTAPAFLVFCGNNRRQRRLHELRGHTFVNDHLDAFFNAAVDGAIVLATFVAAAETAGLGTCPISAIRNHPEEVARVLALPEHVFPIAGLCVGWPSDQGALTPRLGLRATVHVDRHDDATLDADIAEYDARRNTSRPYAARRRDDLFGADAPYGWSEDKARQYGQPERRTWGAFVRGRGFRLE
ncbi:MAG: NADPH-dependent oxidoreductase [Rhodospirillales bacterium 70-18]|nr:MAG: NADPH-dependent oxidoreductase [Rhodospirillales bacterium 70-18]